MRVTERLRRTGSLRRWPWRPAARSLPVQPRPCRLPSAPALAAADPGQRVEFTIIRAGQTHTVPVTLGPLPAT